MVMRAEINCLLSAGRTANGFCGITMYSTLMPCHMLMLRHSVEVVDLDLHEVKAILARFIERNPDDWCGDIGRQGQPGAWTPRLPDPARRQHCHNPAPRRRVEGDAGQLAHDPGRLASRPLPPAGHTPVHRIPEVLKAHPFRAVQNGRILIRTDRMMRIDRWKDLEIHPDADRVPLMRPKKFRELKQSIGQRGQYDPIIVTREDPPRIIDGRHRYRACLELGLRPKFAPLEDGINPLEFVLDKQDLHKQLTTSQRALLGYRLSRHSTVGRPRHDDENCENFRNFSQEEAARRVGVSRKQIELVKRLLESESLVAAHFEEALNQGSITVHAGLCLLEEPGEVQTRAMELLRSGQAKTLARALKLIRSESEPDGSDGNQISVRPAGKDDVAIIHSVVSDLHRAVTENGVDVIISIPSTAREQLVSLGEVADFAEHALAPTGIVAVIADHTLIGPAMEQLIRPAIRFLTELVIVSGTPFSWKGQARDMHRAVLVFGKESSRIRAGDSVLHIPAQEAGPRPGARRLMEISTELILRRLADPGMRVCDPNMLDRPHTALAAVTLGCPFIGASHDDGCVERIRKAVGQNLDRGEDAAAQPPLSADTRDADDTPGTAIHPWSPFTEGGDQHTASRSRTNAGKEQQRRQYGEEHENGE